MNQNPLPGGDELALAMHAWLSNELPADEGAQVAARVANDPEMKADAAALRQTDALLRDWYAHVDVLTPRRKATATAKPVSRRGWLVALAAAALLVIVALPVLRPQTRTLAEEALDRTAERLRLSQGVLATYEVETMRTLSEPDEKGSLEERRKGTGEIKFGKLDALLLNFVSNETWQPLADEPPLERQWGQGNSSQWVVEKIGSTRIANAIGYRFDPAAHTKMDALGGDQAGGSPVDVRTRRAVQGLAALIRSFGRDRYLRWMGENWELQGGKGTAANPWVYSVEFNTEIREQDVPRERPAINWTVKIAAEGPSNVISAVTVEERVVNAEEVTESFFRTSYTIKLQDEAWPAATFKSNTGFGFEDEGDDN